MLPDYNSCAAGRIGHGGYTDRSANLLHAVPLKHDPYTPDSMDSPSPNAMIVAATEIPDAENERESSLHTAHASNSSRRIDRAVSPALLKSKLELIVRNKKHETGDTDQDLGIDIKRSPSDCCLRSTCWPNNEDRQWTARTNRSNSDVSWQRSHLLTHAWIQGKGEQAYHSFGDSFVDRGSLTSSPPDGVDGLPPDLIIPRISIINASNFESNESSVYLHDDKYVGYPDNKLSTYSDDRTKSLSGEAISSDKSDELCEKLNEESNRLRKRSKEDLFLQSLDELIASREVYSKKKELPEPGVEPSNEKRDDEYALFEERGPSITNETLVLVGDRRKEEAEEAKRSEIEVCNDTEILRCESKHEIVVTNIPARSYRVQTQDDNAGNAKLKSKAYKVTERYTMNDGSKSGVMSGLTSREMLNNNNNNHNSNGSGGSNNNNNAASTITRYIHIKHADSSVKIFRETTV
ncbi:inositol polyphosphate-5-phosphatase A isoform X1 [Megalopta genalis]|uniref:inositol polyphosphate-5-phosphatase A isoform X1 n=1 Tax=Megalopta genalis TaxID=115081 RepID=UPI003FD3D0D2